MLERVKRKLRITWSDADTDVEVAELIEDAKLTLGHKLGAEIDFSSPGPERGLFLNYCLYVYNNCISEFDTAYRNEINEIRRKYEVARYAEEQAESVQ